MHPDEHVLEGRHVLEEPNVLKRPADSALGDRVGRLAGHVLAVEHDPAGGRPVDAGEHVEERGLARAVRADQRNDRAARNREVDVVRGDETAELLADMVGDQEIVALAAVLAHACTS